ncbi:MAG: bifunctional diaminohydroxyphosphoribosylaminopyrimidine deaminase/5-amino-6-(5-phosphoribosylamino)uracil reductase RibD [Bacteroidota bacterium]
MTPEEVSNFMKEAIKEGRKALPRCIPNPPVGCVIVENGEIISRGHTQTPGEDHAEAAAIKRLKNYDFSESYLFVTLEPCSFHGRTPSCAKRISKEGFKKVFAGIVDPDKRNNGKGIKILQEANIEVETNILRDIIEADLENYLNKS